MISFLKALEQLSALPELLQALMQGSETLGLEEIQALLVSLGILFSLLMGVVTWEYLKERQKTPPQPPSPTEARWIFLGDFILLFIWIFGLAGLAAPLRNMFPLALALFVGLVLVIYVPLDRRACRRYDRFRQSPQAWVQVGPYRLWRSDWQAFLDILGGDQAYALQWLETLREQEPELSLEDSLRQLRQAAESYHQYYLQVREDLDRWVMRDQFWVDQLQWEELVDKTGGNVTRAVDWLHTVRGLYPKLPDFWVMACALVGATDRSFHFDPKAAYDVADPDSFISVSGEDEFDFGDLPGCEDWEVFDLEDED